VSGSDDALLYVKQFARSHAGHNSFARELKATSSGASPAIRPAFIDHSAQLIIYPSAGTSLWEMLTANDQPNHPMPVTAISRAVTQVRAVRAKPGPMRPAILSQIADRHLVANASLAQRRVFAMLLEAEAATSVAKECLAAWRPDATVHGDLKLEHVVISPAEEVAIVDWELSGLGPDGWDRASLLASLIALGLLGLGRWSDTHATLLRQLLADATCAVEDLTPMVALRLWQFAVEWAAERDALPAGVGSLVQAGFNLVAGSASLSGLTADVGVG
jgi:hypothetical protein